MTSAFGIEHEHCALCKAVGDGDDPFLHSASSGAAVPKPDIARMHARLQRARLRPIATTLKAAKVVKA